MKVVVYVGNLASREVFQEYEFYTNKKTGRLIKLNILSTTYEVVLKDRAILLKIKWNYFMVDEAHRLKNSETSLYTALCEFSAKNKLLITGHLCRIVLKNCGLYGIFLIRTSSEKRTILWRNTRTRV